ncbi:hypothetical protein JJB09_03300 [Rhizobium sp. KVB221]|uniref:Uncharacterized protein n=1 Tax=Rhizobium setariae TaxID=2801340 RepID=A0A936YMU9_9HYPH|nr:hypothetical protein [Rhizobium setariae]MBL0371044.1 hypothetical protein [Rhizobium setariae]
MHEVFAVNNWNSGQFCLESLALALDGDESKMPHFIDALRSANLPVGSVDCGKVMLRLEERIALAILHTFSSRANIDPSTMAAALGFWPHVCASISRFVEFRPTPDADEVDPFLFFSPIAIESIPVPVVDEYIDIVQNRFVIWRRPSSDPTYLARALGGGAPEPCHDGAEPNYLDALQKLKAAPVYDSISLGYLDAGDFRPNIHAHLPDKRDVLPSSIHCLARSATSLEDTYSFKVSVNVSLVAREMKRRALGLQVLS